MFLKSYRFQVVDFGVVAWYTATRCEQEVFLVSWVARTRA